MHVGRVRWLLRVRRRVPLALALVCSAAAAATAGIEVRTTLRPQVATVGTSVRLGRLRGMHGVRRPGPAEATARPSAPAPARVGNAATASQLPVVLRAQNAPMEPAVRVGRLRWLHGVLCPVPAEATTRPSALAPARVSAAAAAASWLPVVLRAQNAPVEPAVRVGRLRWMLCV